MIHEDLILKKQKLSKYFTCDQKNIYLAYQLVEVNLQLGLYEEALNVLNNSHLPEQESSESLFKRSNILLALGRAEEAIGDLKKIQVTKQNQEPVRLNFAHAYFQLGSFKKVNEILSQFDAFSLPSTYILQARSFHYLGELDNAIGVLKEAEQLYPDDAEVKGLLSLILLDKGVYKKATLEFAEAALVINPSQIEGLLTAGMMEQHLNKDFIKAESYFDKSIKLRPNIGRGWLYKGLVLMLKQDLITAKKYLIKACELMPDHIGSWHSLGWDYILLKDIKEAQKCFEMALQLDRNFSETHGGLSVIEALLGHGEEAQRRAKKAIRLNPECLSAQYTMIMLAKAKNNPEQMQKILQKVFETQSGKDAQDIIKIIQGK